jgi:ABC-type nitrate/sulfonate/bicarbonate transport system substrate-binding protein
LVGALGLTACSSTPSASSSAPSKSSSVEPSLTVADAVNATIYGPIWTALAKNLFQKYNVKVNVLSGTENSTAALVSSGQAQIGLWTPSFPLEMASQGQDTKIIFAMTGAILPDFVTQPSITSMAQLQAMKSCRINTPQVGTVFYADAVALKNYFHLSCSIVPLTTATVQVPSVVAGEYQAADVSATAAVSAITQGKVHLLVNPLNMTAAEAKALPHNNNPDVVAFGESSALKAHKVAVERFLQALIAGDHVISSESSKALGTLTATSPILQTDLGALTTTAATDSWAVEKPEIPTGSKIGFIDPAQWKAELEEMTTWGLVNFSPTNPSNSYSKRIDMTYLNSALNAS